MAFFKKSECAWQIVGSLRAGPDVLAQARQAQKDGADVLELRLDALSNLDAQQALKIVRDLRRALPLPLVLTLRAPAEQGGIKGFFKYDEQTREQILQPLIPFADFIDLELQSKQLVTLLLPTIRKHKKTIIFSYHDFKSMPSKLKLTLLAKQFKVWAKPSDILKVAATPKTTADTAWLMQECFRLSLPRKAFIAMGDLGRISRVAGFIFDSCLTYAVSGKVTAPGQLTIKELASFKNKL